MPDEFREEDVESLRLPKNWHSLVRSAVLNVIGIVRIAMLAEREALVANGDSKDARIHQLESEVAMLLEELRINGARMRRVPANRRPQYTRMERMAILQLRAMHGWSKAEASRHFLVSDDTIRDWLRRADDDALVQTQSPVNRFPDFVRYAVQQIKLFCPTLGKVKIVDKLARAGIHIGKTTVERVLKESPIEPPNPRMLRSPADDYDVRIDVTLSYAAAPRRTRRTPQGYLATWLDWISNGRGEPFTDFRDRAVKREADPPKSPGGIGWTIETRSNWGSIRDIRRNVGTVQKDWAVVKSNALPENFCIAVRAHRGWSRDPDAVARYSLVVTFDIVGQEIPIYEPLRTAVLELQTEVEAEIEVEIEE